MELKVVATEGSLKRDRRGRQGSGQQDEGRAEESVPVGNPTKFE